MKNLLYSFLFTILVSLLASCTNQEESKENTRSLNNEAEINVVFKIYNGNNIIEDGILVVHKNQSFDTSIKDFEKYVKNSDFKHLKIFIKNLSNIIKIQVVKEQIKPKGILIMTEQLRQDELFFSLILKEKDNQELIYINEKIDNEKFYLKNINKNNNSEIYLKINNN